MHAVIVDVNDSHYESAFQNLWLFYWTCRLAYVNPLLRQGVSRVCFSAQIFAQIRIDTSKPARTAKYSQVLKYPFVIRLVYIHYTIKQKIKWKTTERREVTFNFKLTLYCTKQSLVGEVSERSLRIGGCHRRNRWLNLKPAKIFEVKIKTPIFLHCLVTSMLCKKFTKIQKFNFKILIRKNCLVGKWNRRDNKQRYRKYWYCNTVGYVRNIITSMFHNRLSSVIHWKCPFKRHLLQNEKKENLTEK